MYQPTHQGTSRSRSKAAEDRTSPLPVDPESGKINCLFLEIYVVIRHCQLLLDRIIASQPRSAPLAILPRSPEYFHPETNSRVTIFIWSLLTHFCTRFWWEISFKCCLYATQHFSFSLQNRQWQPQFGPVLLSLSSPRTILTIGKRRCLHGIISDSKED